ncbi:flagellar biosynthetic protein FliO [Microvirga flavescens]|uniref:flagellar biosynthetic protein FliO n=1 Tax=Microvirga flavescens TaxID=2249811 RepID=UPI001FDF6850|nr:flagellar biosynthetic protein FliO [Microvirga flavescens]
MFSQIEGSRAILYVIAFAIILALVLLFAWVLRRLTGGRLLLPGQGRGRSRQPRLGVVDVYDLDRQRQLILLRRDNVEHLLLVGGLNDVVIETNIVRVAGARLPTGPSEPAVERAEPALEAGPRPLVEPSVRPNIESQLAAQLGAFIRRPSEESDIDEELAPVASVSAPVTSQPLPQVEPLLKPTHVEPAHVEPELKVTREESFSRPAPAFEPRLPEPPAPRPEPRIVTPPPPPPPAPPVPPVFRAEQPVAPIPPEPAQPAAPRVPDALILSDMAKQLEEALKRPAAPAPEPIVETIVEEIEEIEETVEIEIAQVELPEPEIEEEYFEPEEELPPAPAPEPVEEPKAAEAPSEPEPAPAPAPRKVSDPFSVEEIEAEFARLLGRPTDTGSKG